MTEKAQLRTALYVAGSRYQEAIQRKAWDTAQEAAESMAHLCRRLHLNQMVTEYGPCLRPAQPDRKYTSP